jgi:hypothetical protein
MVGLSTSPTASQHYNTIDHAFYCEGNGTLDIYESGIAILSNISGGYSAASILTIRHDSRRVQYIRDGVIVHETIVGTKSFHMDSSFYAPGASISRLQFGPANPVRPNPWVARGNCIAGVSTASKSGGSSAWDSDVFSVESYSACHVVFKASQTTLYARVGLNKDPLTDQSFSSLDYAWSIEAGAFCDVYVNGASVALVSSYTTSTEFVSTYDGTHVRFYKDRVLIHTVADAGRRFYADSSFFDVGAAINSLRFGPGTSLELTDTPQIGEEAATAAYYDLDDFAGTGFGSASLQSFIVTPQFDSTIEISGLSVADNILGDSGNQMAIYLTPTGGSAAYLCGSGVNDTARQQHAYDANYAAAAGQEITISHETVRPSGNPSIHVWQSSLRLAVIKR